MFKLIDERRDDEALATVDKLIADYNDNPHIAEAVCEVGAKYYELSMVKGDEPSVGEIPYWQSCADKAISVWQKLIEHVEPSDFPGWAYFYMGECYRGSCKLVDALRCYQKVADDFPELARAWRAQFLIADCYHQMRSRRQIDRSEGTALIAGAYRQVIAEDPNSECATIARNWLDFNESEVSRSGGTKP